MPGNQLGNIIGNVNDKTLPDFPKLPDTVKARFPELSDWERDIKEWVKTLTKVMKS